MNRSVLTGVIAALAATVIVLAGAFVLLRPSGGTAADSSGGASGEASISSGQADIGARPDCPGPAVGGVELECLGGGYAPPSGEVTVVNVWAWWCEPCRDELPVLAEYAAARPDVTVVGVHADASAAKGAALLTELGVDLPSYQDSTNAFAGTLGLPGVIPITLVFRGGERVGVFPEVFHSAAELDAAVSGVL